MPFRAFGPIAGLLVLAACQSTGPLDLDLALATSGPPVVSPREMVVLQATATNPTAERIEWGRGSSSCQLDLVVTIGSSRFRAVVPKACTDDLSPQGLDPLASRTESLPWGGQVWEGEFAVTLGPGRYAVRAIAGDKGTSPPVFVTVR